MLSFVLGKGLEVVETNKLLFIRMIIPDDIVDKVDTLIKREEQSRLADKEAAWEISSQLPHKSKTEACKPRLLPFYPAFLNSVSQYPKQPERIRAKTLFFQHHVSPTCIAALWHKLHL